VDGRCPGRLARVPLRRNLRRTNSAPAPRCGERVSLAAAQVAAVPFPNAGGLRPDRNPYADAAAPYKVDHLQSSGKFPSRY